MPLFCPTPVRDPNCSQNEGQAADLFTWLLQLTSLRSPTPRYLARSCPLGHHAPGAFCAAPSARDAMLGCSSPIRSYLKYLLRAFPDHLSPLPSPPYLIFSVGL